MKNRFKEAIYLLKIAQQNFEYADAEHIDIAILQLQIAEKRLGLLIREAKGA